MVVEMAVNANKALQLALVTGKQLEWFNPDFTYPFFGEDEEIEGFQGLQVILQRNGNERLNFNTRQCRGSRISRSHMKNPLSREERF